jgi:nicotinamidase/pyrazinamidase
VENIYLCGLARDFCVLYSGRDAAAAGFRTFVLWDLTRPVDPSSDAEVRQELLEHQVTIIDVARLYV